MGSTKLKIMTVLVDRANYGRMRMVMRAISEHPELELMTMCAGTMVLERFGQTEREVIADGFSVHSRVHMEVEGSIPLTMAKSLGFGVVEFAGEFGRAQPDIILLIGDRYEALAAAMAAAYMNIPIAHIQGGEVSGSIDECARHAITKFAQVHFPSTERAAEYIVRMGEPAESVHMVGCPVGDYILQLDDEVGKDVFLQGSGAAVDPADPFFLVIFHPVTTEFGEESSQTAELLAALADLKHPTVFLWPNIDAGADHISKELRKFREKHRPDWLRFITNLTPVDFQKVLKRAAVAIGNSSSFVRDTTFSGTPVVLVGDRQEGRETGVNLMQVEARQGEIVAAVKAQLDHGRYEPDKLYGDGNASARIASVLSKTVPIRQKRLSYINEGKA